MCKSLPVFKVYIASSEEHCESLLSFLREYGWDDFKLSSLRETLQQVRDSGITRNFTAQASLVKLAIEYQIIRVYCIESWHPCFEGQIPVQSSPFRPYPEPATLLSKEGIPHYLWFSQEMKSLLLQLWFYCDQQENRFQEAVRKTWEKYRGFTKFECGYAGEVNNFAAILKESAD